MISVYKALKELKLSKDWVLKGEPKNKTEFENQFFQVIGVDDSLTAINSNDPKDFVVTWEEIEKKREQLQKEWDAQTYARLRKEQYPDFCFSF